jgi:hypothetical protein
MSYFSHIIYRKNLPATCFCLQLAHGGGPGRAGTVLTGLPGTGVSGESAVVSGDAVSLLIPPERLKIRYRISITEYLYRSLKGITLTLSYHCQAVVTFKCMTGCTPNYQEEGSWSVNPGVLEVGGGDFLANIHSSHVE